MVGVVCLAMSGCGGGTPVHASAAQTILKGGWVRYHNRLGWSVSYPKNMHLHSEGPSAPTRGAPGGPSLVTTVTVANFTGGRNAHGGAASVAPGRGRPLPKAGVVLEISGGVGGELLQTPDAHFPLRLADFRPAPWPTLWRHNGVPPPLAHTLDAGGERYSLQLWIGPHASAGMRPILAKIISSIRFSPLEPGTTHGAVAVAEEASHYPVGSFTLLHIKGQACAGGVETCHARSEPIYLVHAPGHMRLTPDHVQLPGDERCIPASSCVPLGSFYAVGWKDKTGYPSACDMRLDRRKKQFYCANDRARWDVGGRPITVPDHGYPTALSFDIAKVAFDGHVIIGGKLTAEMPKWMLQSLWPAAVPKCSSTGYRVTVGAQGATGALVGMTGVTSRESAPCQIHTRLAFAVQKHVAGSWKTIRMVGNPAHAELAARLRPGASIGRDWAWRNYCGSHGRFRFLASTDHHTAVVVVTPPYCNSGGTGSGGIRPFPPKPQ